MILIMLIAGLLCIIFLILAAIHVNWGFGGKFGFDGALPTDLEGKRLMNPGRMASMIVGIVLLGFAIFYLYILGMFPLYLPDWLATLLLWFIPTIFIIRAVGDLKYVGFFKKIKQTKFGKLDSMFYSPLCLIIGVFGLIIAYSTM